MAKALSIAEDEKFEARIQPLLGSVRCAVDSAATPSKSPVSWQDMTILDKPPHQLFVNMSVDEAVVLIQYFPCLDRKCLKHGHVHILM